MKAFFFVCKKPQLELKNYKYWLILTFGAKNNKKYSKRSQQVKCFSNKHLKISKNNKHLKNIQIVGRNFIH